jgi:MFS family permease
VPSGAWADAWSRRRLYALGAFLTAAGYASWTLWPAYAGFALGFVLWGLGGALCSGTLEALLYDELGDGASYARVAGRGGTVAILAMLAATVLASPVFAFGGYLLVGAFSVAVPAVGGFLALGFHEGRREATEANATEPNNQTGPNNQTEPNNQTGPNNETEPNDETEPEQPAGYLATLRAGIGEALSTRRVAWAVLIAALVPGFTALDEYLPLLSRAAGAPTAVVPLLYALPALAMAGGSALAGRWSAISAPRLGAALAAAAVLLAGGALCGLLAGGALCGRLVGMLPIALAFGVLQFAIIVTETRLQESITGAARATVLSVAGFASEVFAVLLYAMFGGGAGFASVPTLFALCA